VVPSVPQPGDIVAGKYEVARQLGKGGMGVVVEATHRKLGSRVAIKFLMPDALTTHDGVARFEREARAAALLRSPYVVRVLDVDATSDGLPFIVMEYLEGHDLASELRTRNAVPTAEAVDWILQACIGLAEAHAHGIVHRDIKPANLYLCEEDGRPIVKIMDFGVSKLLASQGEVDLTSTDTAVGTPSYMAPEQLMSSKQVDHRVDVWALGVVLYRMLAGTMPFVGATPTALAVAIATEPPTPLSSVAPGLPQPLLDAVARALAKDPANRFWDVVELGRALEPFGTRRVPFAAAVASTPAPLARGSDPAVRASRPELSTTPFASGSVVSDRTAPMAAAPPSSSGDEREARSGNGNWQHGGAPAATAARAPRGGALAILVLVLVALVGGGMTIVFALRRGRTTPTATATASSNLVERAIQTAVEPPAPVGNVALSSEPPSEPATTAIAADAGAGAGAAHGASTGRPLNGRGTPGLAGSGRGAHVPPTSAATTSPPADPLHL
jgi:serine/threonine protein kinase